MLTETDTDTLVVTRLSQLRPHSAAEIIALINALVLRNTRIITIKQNLDIVNQNINMR